MMGVRYLHELHPPVVATLSAHSVTVGTSFSCKVRVELTNGSADAVYFARSRENPWCDAFVSFRARLALARRRRPWQPVRAHKFSAAVIVWH